MWSYNTRHEDTFRIVPFQDFAEIVQVGISDNLVVPLQVDVPQLYTVHIGQQLTGICH